MNRRKLKRLSKRALPLLRLLGMPGQYEVADRRCDLTIKANVERKNQKALYFTNKPSYATIHFQKNGRQIVLNKAVPYLKGTPLYTDPIFWKSSAYETLDAVVVEWAVDSGRVKRKKEIWHVAYTPQRVFELAREMLQGMELELTNLDAELG